MDSAYRIILDNGLAGVWDFDLKKNSAYLSPSFKAMFGYEDHELENSTDTWKKIVHPDDMAAAQQMAHDMMESGNSDPFRLSLRYIHKNGSIVWVNCTGMATGWEDGKATRLVGCHIDITREKLAEEKHRKTKELLNKTNLSVRLGGWEYDVVNQRTVWTRVTKQIYELPLDYEPQIGTRLNFFKAGEHRNKVSSSIDRAVATGEGFDIEVILITQTGKELWVRVIGNAEFEDGRCIKVFGTLQDIDAQKKVVEALKRSEDQFQSAFENSTIGMAMVSPEGVWLKVNQQLVDCLGYTQQELNTKTFQDITHPDDLQSDLDLLGRLLAGQIQNYQMEKRYFHKNGSVIWALLSVSLVRDNFGEPLHFVSHIQDITDKKEKEEQIKETLDVVSEQNNRLLNFAYIVSHNLRTHSGNFQSLINLVNDAHTEPEERMHYLQLLQNVSTQLNETILNLNDVVSIQSNIHLQKVQVNLSDYINRTIDVLTGEITRHNAVINNMVDDAVEINYHPAYLESILLNFLTNGIRYRSNTRPPEITINYAKHDKKGVLSVSDNGVGIDMQKHGPSLFGMYKTFHGNSDAKGVGLFITKNQVEAMGGKIEVHSHVDKGTTFKVYLS